MSFTFANVDGRAALLRDGAYFDLGELTGGELADPMDALVAGDRLHELADRLHEASASGQIVDAVLRAPVPTPKHVFGIGLNYADHIAESGAEPPASPVVFTKFPGCIVGADDDIVLASDTTDYEAELVVVIGRTCKEVSAVNAWDVVAGLTCGQDVSDRALQFAASPPHFDLAKSHDTYGPIGPVLVSPDGLADPDRLSIRCEVNGEVRQDSSTDQLIFDVPTLVEFLSGVMTLHPGDLIFTGTPAGVGAPTGRFLTPGDVVTTTIEGIGEMINRVV